MPTVRIELTAFRFLFISHDLLWDERSTYWAKRAGEFLFPLQIVHFWATDTLLFVE